MKKQHIIVTIVFLLIISLSILQVVVSNSLSITGITLSRLETELTNYQRENALLREKMLLNTSLTQIASKAATLGFEEGKSQIVVGSLLPIALRP
ncbi:MAG: hypothetical protein HYV39_01540 [Candidatus Levybacteria bacterium]|nr:hypothetical protein [Candidatus Levybacteria bacterium]